MSFFLPGVDIGGIDYQRASLAMLVKNGWISLLGSKQAASVASAGVLLEESECKARGAEKNGAQNLI